MSDHQQKLLRELHHRTPLATVLQGIVGNYLEGPRTLLVADNDNHVIRAVSLVDSSMETFAGVLGKRGARRGKRHTVLFNHPTCLAVHKPCGSIFIVDSDGRTIRRMKASGNTATFCGNRQAPEVHKEGVGKEATFHMIGGAVVVGDNLFVSDSYADCIGKVPLDGSCTSLFAGQPNQIGFADSPNALFNHPAGLSCDSDGNIFVADVYNHAIRMITPDGHVSTLAGGLLAGHRFGSHKNGPASGAYFNFPHDCAWDGKTSVFVADQENYCVREVHCKGLDIATATVSTLAGQPGKCDHLNGPVKSARFMRVSHIAVDQASGDVFVAEDSHTVRRISQGMVTTFCGVPRQPGRWSKNLNSPSGLALL